MSWASISSNQCISCNNLQDAVDTSVFVLKNTIPVSTKQVTKAEAENYVYIVAITGKTSNQLPVKSNLTAATLLPYSYTLYYDYNDSLPNVAGFNTSAEACATTINSFTVYSSSASVGVGTALYFDAYGTERIHATTSTAPSQYYFKISGSYVTFAPFSIEFPGTGNVIDSIGNCIATIGISTNVSLDIELYISSITVNGVAVDNVTGVDPNTPGNGGGCTTTQIGTYDLVLNYVATTPDQKITLYDSNGIYYCNNTSTGFNSMTFYGIFINASVDVTITAEDFIC